MIRSNPPQLSVGICDMLDTPLIPPPPAPSPAYSIRMPICSGMQISGVGGGKLREGDTHSKRSV